MLESVQQLRYYENCFRNLKQAKIRGHVVPHKPLLLLAVIDLIETGKITSPLIKLRNELIVAFERNAQRYAQGVAQYQPNIGMPFFHMISEPFWQLIPRLHGFAPSATTIPSLRKYYSHAQIYSKFTKIGQF